MPEDRIALRIGTVNHPAYDETMSLVEDRWRSLQAGVVVVLRRLQIGDIYRVVQHLRVGVAAEDLIVAAEAFAQFQSEGVIDRAAGGLRQVYCTIRNRQVGLHKDGTRSG